MKKNSIVQLFEDRIIELKDQLGGTHSEKKIGMLRDLIFTNLTILIKIDPKNELIKEFNLGQKNETH